MSNQPRNRYEGGVNGGPAKKRPSPPKSSALPQVEHPGVVESLIPVWGSGKEAMADWQDGDHAGAIINGAIAISDVVPVSYLGKAAAKTGGALVKVGGAHTRSALRHWMLKNKYGKASDLGVERHHWLFPMNEWGERIPDFIKNQPWNLHEMDPIVHKRLRQRVGDLLPYGAVERTLRGTPAWAQASAASVGGKVVEGVRERTSRKDE